MTKREKIFNKFGGLCAYSGTKLEDDWQIDHIEPVIRRKKGCSKPQNENFDNLVPCQKIINHYKSSLPLNIFRNWYLGEMHIRLSKFPKNIKSIKTIKRKDYLLRVCEYFGISEDKPFSGKFYFESI